MAYLDPARGLAREGQGLPRITGAPVAGTSEVQTISSTGVPTGGTFKLSYKGRRTTALDFDATAAEIDAALGALSTIGGAANVTCAGGPLPTDVTVTFAGTLAGRSVPTITVVESALTGGTTPAISVAVTTPGVDATGRDYPVGTVVARDNGTVYAKTANPGTWGVVGSQS
jgi:hypothetical protein